MKQFLITVAGVLVGLIVFLVVAPIVLISMAASSANQSAAVPQRTVLELDLRQPMADQRSANPFASFSGQTSLIDVLTRLEAARSDNRVVGLYIRANTEGMSAAHAEELREAIAQFRASRRFVVAHIQNDGLRQSLAGYATVAGADDLWLQQAGELMPMGLTSESMFFGDTLRRFGVSAQFESREEYKSAANAVTERAMTPAQREETTALLGSVYGTLTRLIARDRRITEAQARAAVEATPLTAQRAVELRLIDRMGRPEDAVRAALARAGENAQLVSMRDYQPRPRASGPVIAVVGGEGQIVSGPEGGGGPFSDALMNGDAVARALSEAAEAQDVRAIVFRVSSGGGSVVASDQILHALQDARQRHNRVVVVSMGEVAASGGYYVAADANEIVADATTITGSIGVLGGKIVVGPALERYFSVRSERVSIGSPLIGMLSADTPFSPTERAAFSSVIDRAYQEFLTRVATGRRMTVAQVREVARGRVWTGVDAQQRRLVDRIGGFSTAVARARALANIGPNEQVRLRFYPAQQTPLEALRALVGGGAAASEDASIAALARDPRVAAALRAVQQPGGVRAESGAPTIR